MKQGAEIDRYSMTNTYDWYVVGRRGRVDPGAGAARGRRLDRGALAAMDELAAKVCAAVGSSTGSVVGRRRGNVPGGVAARPGLAPGPRRRPAQPDRPAAAPARSPRAAWLDGGLSGGQVQAIVANLSDRTVDLFAEHEAELIPHIAKLTVVDTGHAMRSWGGRTPRPSSTPDQAPSPLDAGMSHTLDGRAELAGSSTPKARAWSRWRCGWP